VKCALAKGSGGGKICKIIDNKDATYTATYTAKTKAGDNTIAATIGGQPVTSTATVTVIPGPVSLSKCTITAPSKAAVGSLVIVTLIARDAYGNEELGGDLDVVLGLKTGSAGGTFDTVTNNGKGTYTVTFTPTAAGKDTITATIGGQTLTSKAPTLTVVAGSVSLSKSTIAVSSSTVALGGEVTVTLVARDAFGNERLGGDLDVVLGLKTGSAGGTFGTVTNNGMGTYTVTFTPTAAGKDTITATINGQLVTSTPPKVTVTASQSLVTLHGAAIMSLLADPISRQTDDDLREHHLLPDFWFLDRQGTG